MQDRAILDRVITGPSDENIVIIILKRVLDERYCQRLLHSFL